jgi:lipoyl(octanoyl) transferase
MPAGVTSISRTGVFQDLNLLEYTAALDLQESARQAKLKDRTLPDVVFFVQHPPVFTFGRNGGQENLIVSPDVLKQHGVDQVKTDRGGNITYHGPGQAVLYPVVDLEQARIGVSDFIYGLEQIMKNTAADFGVTVHRDPKNHGMWKGSRKIGSVGLSLRHGISIHGLALNVSVDLTPFTWIHPCGMSGVTMTSLAQELAAAGSPVTTLSMDRVRDRLAAHFCDWFGYDLKKEPAYV